ncbi:MAG: putative quinol monooxygenase [Candidatus Hodarchaeota archaeon]
MFIACVTVYVKPEYRNAFIKATLENAENTRQNEPKNLRFDVLESLDDPNRFFIYEVFTDESGSSNHKETSHYKKWRRTVEEMMAKPREGILHKNLFPVTQEAFISK